MLRAAITFFVIGLLLFVLGFYGVAGVSLEVGKLILFMFIIFSVITFIAALATGKSPKQPL